MSNSTHDRILPPNRDDYETPGPFFARLHAEFAFDLDAFASPDNAKLPAYFSAEPGRSAFDNDWIWQGCDGPRPAIVFANPPYSQKWLGRSVRRMYQQSMACGALVVGLVPPSISTRWWHDVVLRHASEIRCVDGRLSFEYNGTAIKGNRGDSVVLVFRPGVHGPRLSSMKAKL